MFSHKQHVPFSEPYNLGWLLISKPYGSCSELRIGGDIPAQLSKPS